MIQLKDFDVVLDIKNLQKVEYRDSITKERILNITVIKEDYLANQLNIYLEDGGSPYPIGTNKVQLIFRKSDNTTVEMSTNAIQIVENVIKCVLSTNEFNTLDKLIISVQNIENTVLGNIENATSTLNTTIASAEVAKANLIETIQLAGVWYDPADIAGVIRR